MIEKESIKTIGVLLVVLSLLFFCGIGCTTKIADFSIVSTGAPQYSTMGNVETHKKQKGKDSRLWLLFIPLTSAPTINEAIDRCKDKAGGGDYLERARIYETGWSILVLSYGKYTVIADVGYSKVPQQPVPQSQGDDQ